MLKDVQPIDAKHWHGLSRSYQSYTTELLKPSIEPQFLDKKIGKSKHILCIHNLIIWNHILELEVIDLPNNCCVIKQ